MRIHIPFVVMTAILAGIAGGLLGAEARKPNVLLIITDDQGYGDLACHGNSILETPNLDRLHRTSIRLTNFHTDPTCSPTRAGLMSGRYSTRTGVWHTVMGRHMPRPDEVLMPRFFADSGYRTAIFGKWHLGDNDPYRPQDRGFQEVLIHGGGGVGQIPDYWDNDYFDDTYFHNGKPRKFTGYCTDLFFNEASRFIRANRDEPFFVYLTTNAPHGPFRVDEKYSRPYADRVGGDMGLAQFYGMIANIDENVGRLMNMLDETGLSDNTILIFMTDNGTSRGATFTDSRGNDGKMLRGYNAGMRGRKGSPYEGGHRVPCFIRWPTAGLKGGRDLDLLATHLDLLPTFIDLCGLKKPHGMPLDGTSLAPLLKDPSAPWPKRTLFVHHQELPFPEKWRFCSVMTDKWRLVNGHELYDIRLDSGQTNDISNEHPETVKQLRAAYEEWWLDISVRFDEYASISIGKEIQRPARLTCFEWHSSRRWWQPSIRSGFRDNGFWAIEVASSGVYEIELRRWPEEIDQPITAAIEGGKAIAAVTANIHIADVERSKSIPLG
ncbi:MAG: arylsulfatase, partial [Pirellulaceae bacterium]